MAMGSSTRKSGCEFDTEHSLESGSSNELTLFFTAVKLLT